MRRHSNSTHATSGEGSVERERDDGSISRWLPTLQTQPKLQRRGSMQSPSSRRRQGQRSPLNLPRRWSERNNEGAEINDDDRATTIPAVAHQPYAARDCTTSSGGMKRQAEGKSERRLPSSASPTLLTRSRSRSSWPPTIAMAPLVHPPPALRIRLRPALSLHAQLRPLWPPPLPLPRPRRWASSSATSASGWRSAWSSAL